MIPAFNEGRTIRDVILATQGYVDRVVVCDDGSSDDTLRVLETLDVDVVRHEENRGYGAALVSLFKYCQGIDADVAVSIDGTNDAVMTSVDGITWVIIRSDYANNFVN